MPVPPWRDAVLAAVFLSWAQLEVVTGTVSGPVVINVLAAVASTVALAWRRAWPLPVALVCAGGLAFKTAWGLRLDGLALLSATLVVSYTLGRHEPLGRAALGVGAVVVLAWLSLFGLPAADQTVSNYPFVALWICGPAAAGAALRVQVERAAAAADRAARAELQREEHARTAVLAERVRIARELHDTVAHAVSVMVLHAGAVRSRLPGELDSERRALAEVEETGRRAIVEQRRLLGVLRASGEDDLDDADRFAALRPQPTFADLGRLVEESRRLGLTVELDVDLDGLGEHPPLEPGLEVSAYRVLQEALTNVRKHARARTVTVRVGRRDGSLQLRVADDGVGMGAPGPAAGHGLLGIRERVEMYGGEVRTSSPPGAGFLLEVDLPVVRS